jgi:hypothetical protein
MATSKNLKKRVKGDIAEKLEITFDNLKNELGLKKFKRNIRKATKDLVKGIKSTKTNNSAKIKTGKSAGKKVSSPLAPATAQ